MKPICTAMLFVVLLLLAVFVSSPALAQEWTADVNACTPIDVSALSGYEPLASGYLSETKYQDATISVELTQERYCNTTMHVVRVKLAHPSQLRTMLAGTYRSERTALVTTLAQRSKAVLAINGDYYSYTNEGLVVRQGELMRFIPDDRHDVLMIDDSGNLHIVLNAGEEALTAAYNELGGAVLDGGHVMQAFTFGPALIVNGEYAHEQLARIDSDTSQRAQRMVIAQDGPLSYVIMCCEGPDNIDCIGLTLQEMADFALGKGLTDAYNLDGGGSSSIVFRGEKVNALSSSKNRLVPDIIYFSTGIAAGEGE